MHGADPTWEDGDLAAFLLIGSISVGRQGATDATEVERVSILSTPERYGVAGAVEKVCGTASPACQIPLRGLRWPTGKSVPQPY